MSNSSDVRAQIRAQIRSDYDEHTIFSGGKMPRPRRLPTGSLALDYVSGGGYAFAHMSRFWGIQSSGKTLALFLAFISAQNFGELRYRQLMGLSELALRIGDAHDAKVLKDQAKREREYEPLACLFVNSENSIDAQHMQRLGIKMDKLDIVKRSTIEDIGKIVYSALQPGGYHVIGVDSTTSAMALAEIGDEDDPKNDGDNIYGSYPFVRANRWGVNMDWWRSRLTRDNMVMMTSHATELIGARKAINSSSTPMKPPGGRKLHHEPGLTLQFMSGRPLKRKPNGGLEKIESDDPSGSKTTASAFGKFQPAGGELIARCEKNKVGAQGRTAVLHHDKRTGNFDALHEYERFAKYYRVGVSGTWWPLPDGTKIQQGRQALLQNDALRAQIEAVVLRCAEDPDYEAKRLAGQTEDLVEITSDAAV